MDILESIKGLSGDTGLLERVIAQEAGELSEAKATIDFSDKAAKLKAAMLKTKTSGIDRLRTDLKTVFKKYGFKVVDAWCDEADEETFELLFSVEFVLPEGDDTPLKELQGIVSDIVGPGWKVVSTVQAGHFRADFVG